MNNKGNVAIIGLIIVALGVMVFFGLIGMYNSLVSDQENAKQAWAQVESQYQRRFDLIPNYVEVVKGYAKHEQETFTKITEMRSKIGQTNVNNLDAEGFQQYNQQQTELGNMLSRLLVVVENYPELKANENFAKLQDELAGTENRISVERMRYNEKVTSFNKKLRTIPYNFVSGFGDFERLPLYESDKGAESAPKVVF